MKALICDVDGVLWGGQEAHRTGFHHRLDPEPLKNLYKILDATGAGFVLSSTWRLWKKHLGVMQTYLQDYNWLGQTPDFSGMYSGNETRVKEIEEFMKEHPEITTWAALDDDYLGSLGEHYFRVENRVLLTQEIADNVIKYLNK